MYLTKSILAAATGVALLGTGLLHAHPVQQQMPGYGYGPATPPPWASQAPMPPANMGMPQQDMDPRNMGGNMPPQGMDPRNMGGNMPPQGMNPRNMKGNMPCNHGRRMHGMGNPADGQQQSVHDAHMANMKDAIEITAEQEAAWNEFKSSMDARHAAMQTFMENMNEERQTTENPFTTRAKMWDFRQAQQAGMMADREKLMSAMSEEQAQQMSYMSGHRPVANAPAPAEAPAPAAAPTVAPAAAVAPANPQ